MPAFEVVLRDGPHEEVRLSDQRLVTGQTINVDGREWVMTGEEEAHDSFCTRRFVLVPYGEGSRTSN